MLRLGLEGSCYFRCTKGGTGGTGGNGEDGQKTLIATMCINDNKFSFCRPKHSVI